ncbi:hypothetical protein ACJX0J_016421, partial [Zea mays]
CQAYQITELKNNHLGGDHMATFLHFSPYTLDPYTNILDMDIIFSIKRYYKMKEVLETAMLASFFAQGAFDQGGEPIGQCFRGGARRPELLELVDPIFVRAIHVIMTLM